MNVRYLVYAFLAIFSLFQSCSPNENVRKYKFPEFCDSYEDGDYCAEVIYFNPNNTRSVWNSPVVIEDGKLIEIQFRNGGWMDDNHFEPPEFNTDEGYFEFKDDRGYNYVVGILNDEYCED